MTPTLITPAVAMPVTLAEAKAHCRVDGSEDDAVLSALIAGAVGHLDGWTGILGRCIMPQTWRVTAAAGDVVLPFPDVTGATFGGDALTVTQCALGPVVTLAEDGDVTFTCAMPAHLLATARVAVLLLVGHWYANREAVGENMAEVPMAAAMLIDQMRWRRI